MTTSICLSPETLARFSPATRAEIAAVLGLYLPPPRPVPTLTGSAEAAGLRLADLTQSQAADLWLRIRAARPRAVLKYLVHDDAPTYAGVIAVVGNPALVGAALAAITRIGRSVLGDDEANVFIATRDRAFISAATRAALARVIAAG